VFAKVEDERDDKKGGGGDGDGDERAPHLAKKAD
jgi:hypothetical protein